MSVNRKYYHPISVLITKELAGIITPEEKDILQEWISRRNENKCIYDRIKQQLLVEEQKSYYREEIVQDSWTKLKNQLSGGKSFSMHWKNILSYAAVVLVIFGLIGLLKNKNVRNTTELDTPVAYNIKPGKVQAVLTLEDGQQIPLHKETMDSIPNKGMWIKNQQGHLVYKDNEQQVDKEAYNMVMVPRGGEYQLTLADGTRVWMNAQSELVYPVRFSGKERRVILKGEAYFEVYKDEQHPFVISVNDIEVKVLGTSFNVNAYDYESSIVTTLVEGCVQINNQEQVLGVLKPSEQAIWSVDNRKFDVQTVNASAFIEWRKGIFSFRNDDLETIMRMLARWYDMEYEFENEDLKNEKFYGALNRDHDLRELLEQFERIGKVRFEYHGKKIKIKK